MTLNRMITKRNLGFFFEDKIHNLINQTNKHILREKEIVNKYGVLSNGIDHLIFDDTYNRFIAIQDKWRDKPQQLSEVNHFICAVEYIEQSEQKPVIGIYLTKKQITKGAIISFTNKNIQNKKFYYISDNNMDKAAYKLISILHYLYIFMYDHDGSAIMLNNDN